MPFHWYFTSALPRALLGGYPLALLGLALEPRVRLYVCVATAYVTLYSFLPHKEVSKHDWLAHSIATVLCLSCMPSASVHTAKQSTNVTQSLQLILPPLHASQLYQPSTCAVQYAVQPMQL